MTSQTQLDLWLAGESIHLGDRESGQCCPDFSCCRPELLAAEHERRAFYGATEPVREQMLMTFLGRLLDGRNVHIAGGPHEQGG